MKKTILWIILILVVLGVGTYFTIEFFPEPMSDVIIPMEDGTNKRLTEKEWDTELLKQIQNDNAFKSCLLKPIDSEGCNQLWATIKAQVNEE